MNVLQDGAGLRQQGWGRASRELSNRLPPHFINSPAISPGYLDSDLVQGATSFLCPLISSLGHRWPPAVLWPLGPHPVTLEALSSCEVSLTGGLGPRWGSCRPPLSLLAQSFLSGVMARASPGSLSARRPLRGPGSTALCPQSDQGCFYPVVISAKWLQVWKDCLGLLRAQRKQLLLGQMQDDGSPIPSP